MGHRCWWKWRYDTNSGGMTFELRWLNVQRDGVFLLFGSFTGRGGRGVLHLTLWGRRRVSLERWYRSVRKEPNKERKLGLIGCRRRNLVVSICHSVARERDPSRVLLYLFRFYLHFSSRFRKAPSFQHAYTLTWNLSLNSAVAPVRTDVSRILREFWSPFEPPWNSIHVSRRSRQKSHDCRRDPLLVGARSPCTSYPDWDSRDLID